jgi:hypothetical protein
MHPGCSTSDADTYSYHTPWSCAQHPEVLQVRVYVCVQYSTGFVDVDRGIHERIHIFEKPLIECVSDLVIGAALEAMLYLHMH